MRTRTPTPFYVLGCVATLACGSSSKDASGIGGTAAYGTSGGGASIIAGGTSLTSAGAATDSGSTNMAAGGAATPTAGGAVTTGGTNATSLGAGGRGTGGTSNPMSSNGGTHAASMSGAATMGGSSIALGGRGTATGAAAGRTSAVGGNVATGGKATGGAAVAGGPGTSSGVGGTGTICLDFAVPTKVGTIESTSLAGPSGIVASRANAGVIYGHLDTGGPATVFAFTVAGKSLGEYAISGADNTDWEDIAVGPGPSGGNFIFIGDIGDNAARTGGTTRAEIRVYRVPEPTVTTTQSLAKTSLTGTETLRFTYPDRAHDAETLMLDPVTGDIIIVTKEADGNSSIFRAAAGTTPGNATVLELVGNVKIGTSGQTGLALQASGGDVSPTGDRFTVRSYSNIYVWPRAATLAATFAASPKSIAFSSEPQGEGITFSADGRSLVCAGETKQDIYQSPANCP